MKRWKTTALFLMFGILLVAYGRINVNADTTTGKLGNNITWKLENGVLTISGTGDMLDCRHKKISTWEGELSCGYDYYEQMWKRTMEEQEAIKKVVIEEGITSIAAHAFSYCCNLETIVIPDSVTRIEHAAFYDCRSLHQIRIPDKVTAIEDYTFDGCIALKQVKLSKNLKKIGYQSFGTCRILREISIPQNVEIIGEKAFEYCEKLEKVIWEGKSRLREIKAWAFQDCNIKKLTIPASVKKIENGTAVGGTYEIKVEKGSKKYKSKKGVLYSKDGKTLVRYPRKKKGNTYKIPKGVNTIGSYAFYDFYGPTSKYLKKVTMPDSVKVVECCAFEGLEKLKTVRLSKKLKRIEDYAFAMCSITPLKLPDSLVSIGDYSLGWGSVKGTIIIPQNVKEMGKYAMNIPPSVKKVVIKSKKIKKISKKAFYSDAKKVTIILPKSKKSAYKKLFTKKSLGKNMKFIYK